MATGVTKRHDRSCRSRQGDNCNCRPTFQAWVYSKRDGGKIYKSFPRESEAKSWRADALSALKAGTMRAPKPTTVQEAWDEWHAAATAGHIRNRSGDPYKPSALRAYERTMRLRVLPEFGDVRLADLRRPDLQEFVEKLLGDGLNPSTIQVALLPLRAIYRRALSRGELAVNPTTGLEMPAVRGGRDRIADPAEAAALLAALPNEDRPLWATALYAGLRRGELQALRRRDVDLAAGVIHVQHGWDAKEGEIETKGKNRRRVPMAAVLRDYLLEYRLRSDTAGDALVFGRTPESPFRPDGPQRQADTAWKKAGLRRITLHECRHTAASLYIAAGVNAKALSTFLGHSSITVTIDRYGHLMPGSEEEAAGLLDSYLTAERKRAEEKARKAGGELPGAQTGAQESETVASPHG